MTRFRQLIAVMWLIPATGLSSTGPIELADLVTRGLERCGRLEPALARVEAAAGEARQAAAWDNPEIEAALGRKWAPSAAGPALGVAVSQRVPVWGVRSWRRRAAASGIEAAKLRVVETRLAVHYDILVSAYRYAAAREKTDYAAARVARLTVIRDFLKSRPFASPQQAAERAIVRHGLERRETELLALRGEITAARADLDVYLDPDSAEQVDIRVPEFPGAGRRGSSGARERPVSRHPSLERLSLARARALLEAQAARRSARPSVGIFGSFDRERADGTERTAMGGLAIGIPLFNRNRGLIDAAEARASALERELEAAERSLAANLEARRSEHAVAMATAEKYAPARRAEWIEQMTKAEAGFRAARVDLLTFLELDQQVADAVYRSLDAQVECARTFAALHELSGRRVLPGQGPS